MCRQTLDVSWACRHISGGPGLDWRSDNVPDAITVGADPARTDDVSLDNQADTAGRMPGAVLPRLRRAPHGQEIAAAQSAAVAGNRI